MAKPTFFWANGTSYIINLWDLHWFPTSGLGNKKSVTIKGINGQSAVWNGNVANDPFPGLVDPSAWNVVKVSYPAAIFPAFGTNGSITKGVAAVVKGINALPKGTPFALGGYSQGAVVMSLILKQMLSGSLTSRYADFKGAVMYGNPCRLVDDIWPAHNGLAGGSFSGAWDNPGSTTGGGGCFPAPYRLTSTPDEWFEFSGGRLNNHDPVTSNSTSGVGGDFIALNGELLDNGLGVLLELPFHLNWLTALNNLPSGEGHGSYPHQAPPGYSSSDPTSYQIGLGYLESIAKELAVAPIILPTTTTTTTTPGWSTTLNPPAA